MGGPTQDKRHGKRRVAVAAAMALAALSHRAPAATQYWDANGSAAGAGGATPAGTWGSDAFWSGDPGGGAATGAWTAGNTATFAAGADATGTYTVMVGGTQDADSLRFEEGSVTLSSGTVNLTGSSVVLAATGAANNSTIDSVISGGAGMNLTRIGTSGAVSLTLSGNNTYTGQTTIPSPQAAFGIILNHDNALGASGAGNETVFGTSAGVEGGYVGLPGNRLINENIQLRGGAQSANALGQLRNTGGVNTWAGNIVVNGAQNTTGSGLASIGSSSGTLVVTGQISNLNSGPITPGVAWAKTGAGTVVLRGVNTNVGFNRIFNGILEVQADGALGTATVDGTFDGMTLQLANNQTTVAFRAPPASSGFAYTVHEGITLACPAAGLGIGSAGNAQLDNFGGDNTFAGFVRVGGSSVSGPTRVISSFGAVTGSSLELSGDLYASTSGAGTTPATPGPREIHKIGGGTLIISGANGSTDGVTSGDADQMRLHGNFIIDAGIVALRSTNLAGGSLMGNSVGPMNFRVNAGATLALDNSLAVNTSRLAPTASVTVTGGELKLIGNAAAQVNQVLSDVNVSGASIITVAQPANGNGATTTLKIAPTGGTETILAASVALSAGARLDLSDNKLIVTAQGTGSWNGSAYTGITGLVQSGYNGGDWAGSGIVTGMSDAIAPNVLTALVSMSADDAGYAGGTFGGVSVSSGDALVMYSWGGDANMDGTLNGDDYFQIDSNVAAAGSVFGYKNGDFNYDGGINGDDYFIIDSNINIAQNSPPFPTGSGAAFTAIPEPACATVGWLVWLALARRERRKH